jgi:hypothetical protein
MAPRVRSPNDLPPVPWRDDAAMAPHPWAMFIYAHVAGEFGTGGPLVYDDEEIAHVRERN